VASATWYQVDCMIIYILYILYIIYILYKVLYIYIYKYIIYIKLAVWRSWTPILFTYDIIAPSVRGNVFWSEFYTALCFKANCELFIYFHIMSFINHLGSIQHLHGDKKYNMEYNGVSNWREVLSAMFAIDSCWFCLRYDQWYDDGFAISL